MLTCLIPLAILILLFAGGMIITVYLHSQGAIEEPHVQSSKQLNPASSPATLRREATTEERFYMGFAIRGSEMDRYVRKGVLCFLALAFVLSLLLALFFNSLTK